jgi:hypothetical protein
MINERSSVENIGNIDNTILFYIYYTQSSIENNDMNIEKQMEIAILSNLKQINIGLYNISETDNKIASVIDNITKNAKARLAIRYKMEKKHIDDLYINLIYFNSNDLTRVLNKLLYDTYYFPKKQEDKKNIKGKYSFVLLKDDYHVIDSNKQNNTTIKNKIITAIKNNLNKNIIFTEISFNENVEELSSTYIRNIAITSNYEKFDDMMMKLGYNKKNSDEILNVIRNSSNVMTMGDIFNKTTSMLSNLGANLTSKFTDMVNNKKDNSVNNINENNANNPNNPNGNGRVSYAVYGGYKKRKTRKQRKTKCRKQTKTRKQTRTKNNKHKK